MPYPAVVHNIMIASPSDVPDERRIARDVLHEWNSIYSRDREMVLLPIGWETHSTPQMGERPQEIINKQVLGNADVLIAVFWTRIGSPTGKSPSGTIEEIEEHIETGKPTLIYFSSAPVRPDSVDEEQYRSLKVFREECKQRGLIETYESVDEFRVKLTRNVAQLAITLTKPGEIDLVTSFERILAAGKQSKLSEEATSLLTEAANSRHGRILRSRSSSGLAIQAGGKNFVPDRSPRSESLWEDALKELINTGFIEDVGHRGEVFRVTTNGFKQADAFGAKKETA